MSRFFHHPSFWSRPSYQHNVLDQHLSPSCALSAVVSQDHALDFGVFTS